MTNLSIDMDGMINDEKNCIVISYDFKRCSRAV